MDVDQALFEVGGIRRYHLFLFVSLGFSFMAPTAIDSMMLIFVGWTPPHHCRQFPPDSINFTEEFQEGLDSCSLIPADNLTQGNSSVPCLYGWIYDADPQKEWSIVSEWDLVCGKDYLSELAEILAATGSVLGLLIFSPLLDRFGRKWCFIICTMLFVILTSGMAFTQHFLVYLSLRFVNVVVNECVIAGGAVIMIEMFSKEHRTFSGIGLEFVWSFSYLYCALMYYLVRQWRHFLLATSVPWLIFISFIWILPESVPWLVANGRIEDAIKTLSFMAKGNGVDWKPPDTILLRHPSSAGKLSELQKLKPNGKGEDELAPEETEEEDLQHASYCRKFIILFKDRYTRKHFFICALLWFTNIWVYYGLIFTLPSLGANDKYLSFAVGGLAEIPAYVLCFVIVRFSRRIPVIIFHITAGVVLLLGTVFLVFDLGGKHQHALLLAFGIAGKFCVTASFAVIVLFINELFPTSMRSTGAGLSKSIGRFGNILAPSVAYVAKKKPWIASLILGIISIITGLTTILLPETSKSELANTIKDIHDLYRKPHKHKRVCKSSQSHS